jgi:hypothetical protein
MNRRSGTIGATTLLVEFSCDRRAAQLTIWMRNKFKATPAGVAENLIALQKPLITAQAKWRKEK